MAVLAVSFVRQNNAVQISRFLCEYHTELLKICNSDTTLEFIGYIVVCLRRKY